MDKSLTRSLLAFLLPLLGFQNEKSFAQCTASLAALGSTNICYNAGTSMLQASPSGLLDYQWFVNGVPDSIGSETYTVGYGVQPGTYVITVQITDFSNCTVISNPITVTVSATPFLYWYNGEIGCVGDTLHMWSSVDTATSFSWTGPNGFTANTISAYVPNFQAANIGTYTLVADNNGCSSSISVGLDTFSGPTPSLTAYAYTMFGNPFCEGEWFGIDGIDSGLMNVTYSWTGPNNFTYNDHYYKHSGLRWPIRVFTR